MEGFVGGAALVSTVPIALAPSGGFSYTSSDLAKWRQRINGTNFIRDNDVQKGSPGDWSRIISNSRRFQTTGEDAITSENRSRQGAYARDAAFVSLILDDSVLRASVIQYLLQQIRNPENDFATNRCFRYLDGATTDGFYAEGPWLLRHILTFDYLRHAMSATDRLAVENYLRRQAYFFAAQIDWGMRFAFPKRLVGDYSVRNESAAPTTENAKWYSRGYDTNNDCKIDSLDDQNQYPARSYVMADGTLGPKLSWLSLWFNNRRSASTVAFGAAGLMLKDQVLIERSKRYVMEWLTYGVYPDGSEGEYGRNGNYCIPKQGLQYAQANVQAATLLATWQAVVNDNSLREFKTTDGLFGTESGSTSTIKSLPWLIDIQLRLVNDKIAWYFYEPWRPTQFPRPETALSKPDIRYLNQNPTIDTFHELGLLVGSSIFPNIPIYNWISRNPNYTQIRFPGSTGNLVSSGISNWSDVFGALPAIFLLYQ